MSKIRDRVDHFLFNFSYSIKIKSIIYIALGAAVFIAVMLIVSQHHLYQRTQKQLTGLYYLNAVNRVYETSLLYHIADELEPRVQQQRLNVATLRTQLQEAFDQLTQATQIVIEGHESSVTEADDLSLKVAAIGSLISELTIPNAARTIRREVQIIKLQEMVKQLINTIAHYQDLNVSVDETTFRLLHALTGIMPDVQMHLTTLITSGDLFKPIGEIPLEQLAQLVVTRNQIATQSRDVLAHLNTAQEQSPIIAERVEDPFVQNILEKYSESINLLLSITPPDSTPSSIESLASTGLPAVVSSFKISNDIGTMSDALIRKQSRTLKWREYFGAGFISFGCTVGLAAYTTRLLRRPLYVIRQAAEELSRGNLSSRIHVTVKDEVNQISEAFNQMVDQIETIIQQAGGISNNLASSASSIFNTAKQLETNVVRQERAITQIASNAKGVSRTVQDFAKSLQEVSQAATLTTQIAETSRNSLNDMEAIMHQMAKASMNIVKTLSDLQDKIGAINKVISAIVRIADQINLLSLNTAIRSGKEGTHHLGFSVVAEKINELANQTALATLDIEELVQKIIYMVSDSVKIVDHFSDQIRHQVFEAADIGEQLKRMISQTQEQFEAFETVNVGMQEQAKRASQIHEAISALTNTAQKTTQSVRNLYLEIEYLHHSTGNLLERTRKLTNQEREESLVHAEK